MKLIRFFITIISIIALSACAGIRVPNGKIDPAYTDLPLRTHLVEMELKDPLRVIVPTTSMTSSGGGLLGALIVTAVSVGSTAVSYAKRSDKTAEIKESIDPSIYKSTGKQYRQIIKKANWIKVIDETHLKDIASRDEAVKAGDEIRVKLDGDLIGVVGYAYTISSDYSYLTQSLRFDIAPVKDGKSQKTVYQLLLSEIYRPNGTISNDLDNNYVLWIKDNNKNLKKAIKETSEKLNKLLKDAIRNPYVEKETKEKSEE